MRKIFWTLLFTFILGGNCFALGKAFVDLHDPAGDDHGPGHYVYPTDRAFVPGSFDISGFSVFTSEGYVTFIIKFKKNFPGSRLSLQNIDIYIDEDHKRGSGETVSLPGRNVNFDSGSGWEKAVLITGKPVLAKKELMRIAARLADKVIIPKNFRIVGNSITCDIPTLEIGVPSTVWGYMVFVSPASDAPEKVKMKFIALGLEEPLLLNAVLEKRGPENFGGGDVAGVSPNIIDLIVGSGESQEKILSSYNSITRTRVTLKAIYPLEYWLEVGEGKKGGGHFGLEATILAISPDRLLTIDKGTRDGVYNGRIGKIYDDYGDEVTDVIVEQANDTYSICKIMKVSIISYVNERMKVKFK